MEGFQGKKSSITTRTVCRWSPLALVFLVLVWSYSVWPRANADDVGRNSLHRSTHLGGSGPESVRSHVGEGQTSFPRSQRDGQGSAAVTEGQSECQTVMFFHIPKTGGESLNDLWHRMAVPEKTRDTRMFGWRNYQYRPLRVTRLTPIQQRGYLMKMTPWSMPSVKGLVVELHCGDAMSFMQARETVDEMRRIHESNGCGFFAFTILRPPIDWVVSLYDDICHRRLHGHKDTCPQQRDMSSREEMLGYPHENGLVSYLWHGWNGWHSPGPVDRSSVADLAEAMDQSLDLVAFTEEVPHLRSYLSGRFASEDNLTKEQEDELDIRSKKNVNMRKTIHISDFNDEELRRLNATLQLDWELYRHFEGKPRPWS